MLAIDVEFLTGSYVATAFDNRRKQEWPPHPARLFAAMVAAWADGEEFDRTERQALEALERLGPPKILCDPTPALRAIVDHYVPDNDVTTLSRDLSGLYTDFAELVSVMGSQSLESKEHAKAGRSMDNLTEKMRVDSAKVTASVGTESASQIAEAIRIMPDERGRQARTYPTVIPRTPVVRYEWGVEDFGELDALDAVLGRVHRLGHSSSFVSCSVVQPEDAEPADDIRAWVTPALGDRAGVVLRVPGPGMTRRLVDAFAVHQASESRVTPSAVATYVRESGAESEITSVHGGAVIVVPFGPTTRPPLNRVVELTSALRGSLMKFSPEQPAPEILTGHRSGDRPTPMAEATHAALIGLPAVAFEHADGRLHGLAVVLPRSASPDDEALVRAAVRMWRQSSGELFTGTRKLRIPSRVADVGYSVSSSRWTEPAMRWATATPIVLDRFPKGKHALDIAGEVIARSCEHLGLPIPVSVRVSNDPVIVGSRPVRGFPAFATPLGNRPAVHALITFGELVRGPVLIGAGRYLGMGLCVPLPGKSDEKGALNG